MKPVIVLSAVSMGSQTAMGVPLGELMSQAPVVGAIILVVWYFLRYLRESEDRREKTMSELTASYQKALADNTEAMTSLREQIARNGAKVEAALLKEGKE